MDIHFPFSPATPTPVQESVHFTDVVLHRCPFMCAGTMEKPWKKQHWLGIRWLSLDPDYNCQGVILLTLMYFFHFSDLSKSNKAY